MSENRKAVGALMQRFDFAGIEPDRDAIVWNGGRLSFAELERAIRRTERDLGNSASAPVVLELSRSAELLVAMLGCLRAGRTFVVIDPQEPPARRRHMLADLGEPVRIGPAADRNTDIGIDLAAVTREPDAADRNRTWHPDASAYVVFTSGSTGRPKGVCVTYLGLTHYLGWAGEYYGMNALDGAFAHLNPGFDASITQLLLPLLHARRVRIVPPGQEIEGLATDLGTVSGRWLLKLTPSQLVPLKDALGDEPAVSVCGELVLGGEPLYASHLQLARAILPGFRIHNEYGPSETVVGCTVYSGTRVCDGQVPIGTPVGRTRTALYDRNMRRCDPGGSGELCIAGPGVATGYLNDPRTTAQQFVPDPDGGSDGARTYRSGDYAVLDPAEAILLFRGRRDAQIKVRGYRVELAEVDHGLNNLAGIEQALAEPVRSGTDVTAITAYVKLAPGHDLAAAQTQMRDVLPVYMCPDRVVVVDEFPLTANGKVDRRRLVQAHDGGGRSTDAADDTVAQVRQVWRRLLGHGDFGLDDQFYSCGGHSILSVRLRAALRKRLGADIQLAQLLRHCTVREIAELCTANRAAPDDVAAPAPGPRTHYPLSSYQEALLLAIDDAQRNNRAVPYTSSSGLRITGPLDTRRLRTACESVIRRHGAFYMLIRRNGTARQELQSRPRFEWSEETCEDAGQTIERLNECAREELSIEAGPLCRVCLLSWTDNDFLLLFQVHHLYIDQWSMNIVVEEILRAYDSPDVLPAPAPLTAFGEYCLRQRGCDHDTQLDYWQRRFRDAQPSRSLTRRRRPGQNHAARNTARLSRRRGAALVELARHSDTTMNTLTMIAAALALSADAAVPVIRLSLPITARTDDDPVVGYFLNTVIVELPILDRQRLCDLVRQTETAMREALANGNVPYTLVRENISQMQAADFAHARFVYVDQSAGTVSLPHCEVAAVELPRTGVKFPLLIGVENGAGGLLFHFDYDPGQFSEATVEKWAQNVGPIVEGMAANPQQTLTGLMMGVGTAPPAMHNLRQRLGQSRRVSLVAGAASTRDDADAIATSPDWLGGVLLVQAPDSSVPLEGWVETNRGWLGDTLESSGAVLLRGFAPLAVDDFGDLARRVVRRELADYENRSTPRTRVGDGVFTSTEYPASEAIPLHCENAHHSRWPDTLFFFCERPAGTGGETTLADARKVYRSIAPHVRDRFADNGVTYSRCYGSAGLSWSETFQTDSREQVEAYCRAHAIEWRWDDEGGLRTWQTLPAVRRDGAHGPWVWFNQAHLFHVSNLGAAMAADALAVYGLDRLPRHATFGDGTQIDDDSLAEIRRAYDRWTIPLAWQHNDLIVLNNALWSHGRRPFEGGRSILVAMGNMRSA